ncbi:MAG: segregation/condensation protein A, partial [Nitrospirota bacterium]|nr:segregation/condensation protein A [Nitrospirota bacterium]
MDSAPSLDFPDLSDLDDEQAYEVKLEAFTGPMDLLLHLIRKQKINIYDIPIALIAKQYLEYLSIMKTLNLSMAGEFLVMAATLLYIKSRTLLPKEAIVESEDEEVIDPRSELVRQLIEYERFKDAAGSLVARERLWQDSFIREPLPVPKKPEQEEEHWTEDLQIFDLLSALQGVLDRAPTNSYVEVSRENWTVEERIQVVMERLETEATIPFEDLFEPQWSRPLIIVTFLGLLELVRMNLVRLFQGEWFGPIHVTRRFV